MRTITQHIQHVYKSKFSAMRAGRKAVGHRYLVEAPELQNRFDGEILITPDMISVTPVNGGWCCSYTFDIADVVVTVRGADGQPAGACYADVAHWRDACTPCEGTLCEIGRAVAAFRKACEDAETEAACREVYDSAVPKIQQMCREAGVDYGDVLAVHSRADRALLSSDPSYVAETIVLAEPYGLASGSIRMHLLYWASRRGLKASMCLDMARKNLARKAA